MTSQKRQLRLRVFAGPNGSGKSTVIQAVRNYRAEGLPIDFGHYINADDIAQELRMGALNLGSFGIRTVPKEFQAIALASGLIGDRYPEKAFKESFSLRNNILRLQEPGEVERLAQLTADFLRTKLLALEERFSFETVFSHPSKIDFMRQATLAGYKVYLLRFYRIAGDQYFPGEGPACKRRS